MPPSPNQPLSGQSTAQPAPQPYAAPAYAPYQRLFDPNRPSTVKGVYLGDVLFLIAGVLLIGVGFENLGWISSSFAPGMFVLLGLLAIPTGLIFVAHVVMPHILDPVKHVLDMGMFVMSLIFLLWGFLGSFLGSVAALGGFLLAAGLFGLAGVGLKLGVLK
jgi:hypothetical protein